MKKIVFRLCVTFFFCFTFFYSPSFFAKDFLLKKFFSTIQSAPPYQIKRTETQHSYQIEFFFPEGIPPFLKVKVKNQILFIQGNRKTKHEKKQIFKNVRTIKTSEQSSSFSFSFPLPKKIDSSKTKTEKKGNTLKLIFSKRPGH